MLAYIYIVYLFGLVDGVPNPPGVRVNLRLRIGVSPTQSINHSKNKLLNNKKVMMYQRSIINE